MSIIYSSKCSVSHTVTPHFIKTVRIFAISQCTIISVVNAKHCSERAFQRSQLENTLEAVRPKANRQNRLEFNPLACQISHGEQVKVGNLFIMYSGVLRKI